MPWNRTRMDGLAPYITLKFQRSFPYVVPWRGSGPCPLQVYRIPTALLHFNLNNTRIRAELEGGLHKTGQSQDPDNGGHARAVQNMLLGLRWSGLETTKLMHNLQKRGQLDPVTATPDGTLIDGNRRLAIFRHLADRHPDSPEFRELETCVLPHDSTGDDIKEFEVRLQVYQQFHAPHGDINTSLEFRHLHRELGWDLDRIREISDNQYPEAKIQRMMDIIDMIDEYMGSVPPANPHGMRYSSLNKGWESFEILHKIIRWTRRANPYGWENLVRNRKRFGFAIIRSEKTTHSDMKNFYSILRSEEAGRRLAEGSDILSGRLPPGPLDPTKIDREIRQMGDAFHIFKTSRTDPGMIIGRSYRMLDAVKTSQIRKNDRELKPLLDMMLRKIRMLQDQI